LKSGFKKKLFSKKIKGKYQYGYLNQVSNYLFLQLLGTEFIEI
jgi:hypothetical protein